MTSTPASSKMQLELFVKSSSVDKTEKGSCPISQKWFMVFYQMVRLDLLDFRLTVVNLDNLPESYLRLNVARRFPVVTFQSSEAGDQPQQIFDNDDEIEALMEKQNVPNMTAAATAFRVTQNLYRNFNSYLVNPGSGSAPSEPLIKDLAALDSFMASRNVPYLSGYDLGYVDCQTMPKLQHIRVVCSAYKGIELPPADMLHLWKYYDVMYKHEAFLVSCPSDRDILLHYVDKVRPQPRQKTPASLIGDHKTLQIPPEIQSAFSKLEEEN